MKKILFLSFMFCLTLLSCVDNDDISGTVDIFDKPVIKNDGGPLDTKIVSLYEKYNTYFKYEFEHNEYRWNWTSEQLEEYSFADVDRVEEMLDFIISNVYEVFPEKFSKQYMPYKVLMVDTLENSLSGMLYGDIGVNYVVVADVSDRLDDVDKEDLKVNLLSLFVEEMFSKLVYPEKFSQVSLEGYALPSLKNIDPNDFAFLKRERVTDRKAPTVMQDFGDFVAMIVYLSQEEKEELFEKNFFIKKKMELVIKYFKDYYNITLPTVD